MKKRLSRKIVHRIYLIVAVLFLTVIAIGFLAPTILTITNSFMASSEISANYGVIFGEADSTGGGGYSSGNTIRKTYIAEKVNLKLIPDKIVLSQYVTALVKSPAYLLKFWNSVILVLPILFFQIAVALGASYCFARFTGRFRELVFFIYIILMLMPYQVTLVPNYLVADWLGVLNTRWAIILPGIFSPFSVFILTKFLRRVPSSMMEAAKLDGAGEGQLFLRICVPLCKSVIFSVAILVFIDYWNMVEQPLILLADTEMHPLSVFLSKINASDIGLAFAVATVYMIPSILLFLYSEEYLIEGVAYSGGIKG